MEKSNKFWFKFYINAIVNYSKKERQALKSKKVTSFKNI